MNMRKKKIILLVEVVLFMTFLTSCKAYYYIGGAIEDIYFGIKGTVVRRLNKSGNDNLIKNYLISKYSKVLYDDFQIIEISAEWSDSQGYRIIAPFMEKPFEVWIDNRTHEIFGDNFYEVLTSDPKFQHLYSNWVKKQIGCEDENVELKIGFQKINFENIKNINNSFDEIFENIDGSVLQEIKIDRIDRLNEKNAIEISKDVLDTFNNKKIAICNNMSQSKYMFVDLYRYDTAIYDRGIYFNSKDDLNNFHIEYENGILKLIRSGYVTKDNKMDVITYKY